MQLTSRTRRTLRIIGAGIIIIVLYNATPASRAGSAMHGFFVSIGSPFTRIGNAVSNTWFGIVHGRSLAFENTELRKKNAFLEMERNIVLESNNTLATLSQYLGLPIITAHVSVYTTMYGVHELVINKGAENNIAIGMPAISQDGVYIGKVSSTTAHTAHIKLITDTTSAVAVYSAQNTNAQAIIKGVNGISLHMELIPQDVVLQTGDIAVTSLLENNTPAGLPIGKIISVTYQEGDLFQTATVQPLVTMNSIRQVGIIVTQ